MFDLQQHLVRQMVFSRATFGPGERTKGVIDHIRKELIEIEQADDRAEEWVDVVILALDGLTRELWARGNYRLSADDIAQAAVRSVLMKQAKNERRNWPDWRSADPEKAIEHDRSEEAANG